MLARRLRRRPNINPALGQCTVFAGVLQHLPSQKIAPCIWCMQPEDADQTLAH